MVAGEFDSERFPDNFYQGIVIRLDRGRGRGAVRSLSGREIPFQFPFVTVQGAAAGGRRPGIEMLYEGGRVGFDVAWTSHGLMVSTLKPLD